MTTQEATKDICIDIIFDKLAKGEVQLKEVDFDLAEWLDNLPNYHDKNITCLAEGTTYHQNYGLLEEYPNFKERFLILYKENFLIEFETDNSFTVYNDEFNTCSTFTIIKQLIVAPTKKQITKAKKRVKALIDQYEAKRNEAWDKHYEELEESKRLFYLSVEEDQKRWEMEEKAEMEKQQLEMEKQQLEIQRQQLETESQRLETQMGWLKSERQLLASGFFRYLWHKTKKNIKKFICSIKAARRSEIF